MESLSYLLDRRSIRRFKDQKVDNLTIKKILSDGGSAILMSHLGRPKDGPEDNFSLKHVVSKLKFPYWARDWMQSNRNLFKALKLERRVMFIILTLIVLVAAFNIAGSLVMMVMEKRKDIAILKAMGATARSIGRIFVIKGLMIGLVGTVLGTSAGLVLCTLLKRYSFIHLPADIYYINTLPVNLKTSDVLLIALCALFICFVATLYPARQAAGIRPVEAIRHG